MFDLYESLYDIDDCGRFNISEPIRQGLIYLKKLKNFGRQLSFSKWQLSFAIISSEGMFFFKPTDIEAGRAQSYIYFSEAEFKVNEVNVPGKFCFELITTSNHYQFECCNFSEKDEWKKALQKGRQECLANKQKPQAGKSPRKNSPTPTSTSNGSSQAEKPTIDSSLAMKAEVRIMLKDTKDLHDISAPFCKVVMGHDVFTSKTAAPKGNDFTFGNQEHVFTITKLPVDFLLIMYDGKEIVGSIQMKVELAGERGDQKEFLDVRSVKLEDKKAKGKFQVFLKTRYDAETQKRVTFGVRLSDLMKRESHQSLVVPDIAYKCLKVLNRQTALEMQGIFRVPGNRNKMRDYELKFDTMGTNVDFSKSDDEHMVASMFKMFLRDLPEPLVPYELFEAIVDAATKPSKEEIIVAVRQVVSKLAPENFRLLSITCCLLQKITQYVDKNLMKPTNLAIVFGPVFCAAPPGSDVSKQQMVSKLPALSSAAENMIIEYHTIFGVDKQVDPIEEMVKGENKLSIHMEKVLGIKAAASSSTAVVNPENNLVTNGSMNGHTTPSNGGDGTPAESS